MNCYGWANPPRHLRGDFLKHLQTILRIHPSLHLAIEYKSGIFQRIINCQSIQATLGLDVVRIPVSARLQSIRRI